VNKSDAPETASVTMPGTVQKIIKNPHTDGPEKAEIRVDGADELYREIRIENTLQNEKGEEVALKAGAEVNVTVEAPADATTQRENPKKED
jgi:hypothetical protein